MPQPARLITTIAAPLAFSRADDPPRLEGRSAARLLVQRGDTELIVQRLEPSATDPVVRFPAPWPRRFGEDAVSPAGDLAVFTGPHAVRAVDSSGSTRWELRHRCWADCAGHESVAEYAHDRGHHRYHGSGSASFSADGTLVWAHIRGPLAHEEPVRGRYTEEWLVIDAGEGTVLGRARTHTAAAGSDHVPHPDPGQMGLSIGEGQDGTPLRWGRWDGHALTVDSFGDEDRVLLAVSPSGDRLLTVTHDQDTLALHRTADGTVEAELSADVIPGHPALKAEQFDLFEDDESRAFFDYEGGFLDEDTVVVGTAESDEEFGAGRHWLVDTTLMQQAEPLVHPFEVSGPPRALGDGTWYTLSATENALHLWTR
ncbi:hypothetical protein [Streptomyces aureus]|uniref:hypothetical protein n=1 Tax=Streptomyces aureus TaxID=193461 RepID=UPI00056D30D7|nr:hypothetical protein [Streptomyces aureus]